MKKLLIGFLLVLTTLSGYSQQYRTLYAKDLIPLPSSVRGGIDTLKISGKIKINSLLFPNVDGTNGQFLTTDGADSLLWSTLPLGYSVTNEADNRVITSTGAGTGNAEANLTFDDSGLGQLNITGPGGLDAIQITNTSVGGGIQVATDGGVTGNTAFRWAQGGNEMFHVTGDSGDDAELDLSNSGVVTVKLDTDNDSYFNGGDVGIGDTTPDAKLDVEATTEQLRLGYNGSNYFSTTVASNGDATFDVVGTSPDFTFSDNVNIPALTLTTDLSVANGGSGRSSATAYAPIFGGTTSTGAHQSGTVGTSGQVLKSNGAGALPTFQDESTTTISNDFNDRVTTAVGDGTLNGEANLTFDGSTLNVTGQILVDFDASSSTSGSIHVDVPDGEIPAISMDEGGTRWWQSVRSDNAFHISRGNNYNSNTSTLSLLGTRVGINNDSPDVTLDVESTTEQLRLSYDASNYFSTTVASNGDATFDVVGTSPDFTFSDNLNIIGTTGIRWDYTDNDNNAKAILGTGSSSASGALKLYRWAGVSSQFYPGWIEMNQTGGVGHLDFKVENDVPGDVGSETVVTAMSIQEDGKVGIGTSAPSARVHSLSTTEQLRLGYDASNYFSTTVASNGDATFNVVGTSPDFTFSDDLTVIGTATADRIDVDNAIFNGEAITANSSDGSDNLRVLIAGGGGSGVARGSSVVIYGNEHATNPGGIGFLQGNVAGAETLFTVAGAVTEAMMDENGDWGYGTTSPSAKIHVQETTEQLRLGYDASNYFSTTIASNGDATFNVVGTSPDFTFSDNVNIPALTLTTDLSVANGGTGASTLTGLLLGNGTSAFTGVTTSAGIAGAISNETGSGALVFGTSPTTSGMVATTIDINSGAIDGTPIGSSSPSTGSFTTGIFSGDVSITGVQSIGNLSNLIVSSGTITIARNFHTVTGEGSVSDNLDTVNGGAVGTILVLVAGSDTQTITLTESGNMELNGTTFALDNTEDTITLIWTGSEWREISRSDNGA
jgi:hypothetical protein